MTTSRTHLTPEHVTIHNEDYILWLKCSNSRFTAYFDWGLYYPISISVKFQWSSRVLQLLSELCYFKTQQYCWSRQEIRQRELHVYYVNGYELQHLEELIAHPHNTSVIYTAAVHQPLQEVFGLQNSLLTFCTCWVTDSEQQESRETMARTGNSHDSLP